MTDCNNSSQGLLECLLEGLLSAPYATISGAGEEHDDQCVLLNFY